MAKLKNTFFELAWNTYINNLIVCIVLNCCIAGKIAESKANVNFNHSKLGLSAEAGLLNSEVKRHFGKNLPLTLDHSFGNYKDWVTADLSSKIFANRHFNAVTHKCT